MTHDNDAYTDRQAISDTRTRISKSDTTDTGWYSKFYKNV